MLSQKKFSYFLRGSGHKSFTISLPSRIDLASAFGYNVKYTGQALLSFRRSGVYYLLPFRGSVSDRRIPQMVPPGQRQRTFPRLHGGSPLREDDAGESNPPASTVGRVPLTGGFHGLRPLNDGDLGVCASTRPPYPAPHSLSCTPFRGSEAYYLLSFRACVSRRRIPQMVLPW